VPDLRKRPSASPASRFLLGNVTCWHQTGNVSAGREPHATLHTALITDSCRSQPGSQALLGEARAGRFSRRRALGAWPSAVGRMSSIASRSPPSAAPAVSWAGLGNSKAGGSVDCRPPDPTRPGAGLRQPMNHVVDGRRLAIGTMPLILAGAVRLGWCSDVRRPGCGTPWPGRVGCRPGSRSVWLWSPRCRAGCAAASARRRWSGG
jgi:hypothetical protein